MLWSWEPLLSLKLTSLLFRALIKNYRTQREQNGRPVAQGIVMIPSHLLNVSHSHGTCYFYFPLCFFLSSLRQQKQEAKFSKRTVSACFLFKHPDVCICILLQGGAISILTACEKPQDFAGVVLIAPMIQMNPESATPFKVEVHPHTQTPSFLPY